MGKWSVVVPTCRPESYARFVEAWTPLFEKHNVNLIPVWDIDGKRDPEMPWFIPTGTDMIRSWGFYKAWQGGSEYTLTLDDDVVPLGDPFAAYEREFEFGAVCSPYLSVGAFTSSHLQMRGFPYLDRKPAKVAIQYGGWHGILDYDAPTQLVCAPEEEVFTGLIIPVPRGVPVTTCIMNCAFRTEYAPIMWQLPMLDGKYNRFGDIWSGLIQKKVLDWLGEVMLINGNASVRHERASNAFANLEREAPGAEINEALWERLRVSFLGKTPPPIRVLYRFITNSVAMAFPGEYRQHFVKSRDAWLELFGW